MQMKCHIEMMNMSERVCFTYYEFHIMQIFPGPKNSVKWGLIVVRGLTVMFKEPNVYCAHSIVYATLCQVSNLFKMFILSKVHHLFKVSKVENLIHKVSFNTSLKLTKLTRAWHKKSLKDTNVKYPTKGKFDIHSIFSILVHMIA